MSSCCLKGLKIGTQSYSDEKSIPTHPLQAAFSRELSPASLPALCLSLAWLCVHPRAPGHCNPTLSTHLGISQGTLHLHSVQPTARLVWSPQGICCNTQVVPNEGHANSTGPLTPVLCSFPKSSLCSHPP